MNHLDGLLDTNILIDIFRGHGPAINWMHTNPNLTLGLPSIVRVEMILGAENKQDQQRVITLLTPFPVIFTSEYDSRWAMEQFEKLHLSHQVEILDCFIAAMSIRLAGPLYTRNVGDMKLFPGVSIVTPY